MGLNKTASKDNVGHEGSASRDTTIQLNALATDVDALTTKVNAILTAAATSLAAVAAVPAAAALSAKQVSDGATNTVITR